MRRRTWRIIFAAGAVLLIVTAIGTLTFPPPKQVSHRISVDESFDISLDGGVVIINGTRIDSPQSIHYSNGNITYTRGEFDPANLLRLVLTLIIGVLGLLMVMIPVIVKMHS